MCCEGCNVQVVFLEQHLVIWWYFLRFSLENIFAMLSSVRVFWVLAIPCLSRIIALVAWHISKHTRILCDDHLVWWPWWLQRWQLGSSNHLKYVGIAAVKVLWWVSVALFWCGMGRIGCCDGAISRLICSFSLAFF